MVGQINHEPLIYTTKGNVPASSLRYVNRREDVPGTVVLVEEWFLDDELVKRNVHALPLVGICLEGAQSRVG